MSFNFVNLACIQNSGYFITQSFFRVTWCTCMVIEMAACEMESSVCGPCLQRLMGCIRYLMMKIDILWLCSKMTPLWPIFQERYLKSVLWFSKGWCYNLYTYRKKEIFFTPAAKYIHYNFWYIIFSNVILFHVFKFRIAAMHTQFFNDIFSIYGICIYIYIYVCV